MKQFLLFILTSLSISLYGQIEVVEYSASNLNSFPDSFFKYEDWIKIKNASNETILLEGWALSDKEDNPQKWIVASSTSIGPQESRVVFCSGRDIKVGQELHTNFKLSQTSGKDKIILTNPEGNIVNNIELETTLMDHSWALYEGEWVVNTNPRMSQEPAAFNVYKGYTTPPTLSLQAGFYEGPQTIAIENNHPNSTLHYTLNGLDVTADSPVYDGPITLSTTNHLKAKAIPNDSLELPGKEAFATYILDATFSLPVFSIGAEQSKNLANGDGALIPIGSVEYFDENGTLQSVSYGEMNRHGKDSWGNPHRSLDYICRDEMGYTKHIEGELFPTTNRDEFQRLMFRASGDDNYPARINSEVHDGATHIRDEYVQTLAVEGGLHLDCRKVQRVILFLNGDYWGVYGLREKVADHDFTSEYYDQGKYDLEFLSHWGVTNITYGEDAMDNWAEFRDFILQEDMSLEANYQRVTDEMDVLSLIDYFLVNLNVVAADWIDWNTGWWRGLNPDGEHKKWGYILWDMDATFDYYINYTGIPNTDYDAVPCSLEEIPASLSWGEHEDIILKLLEENQEFRTLYFQRYSDLANESFSCENMLSTFDRMVDVIRPEMPRQIARWGGTMEEWSANIDTLRIYIENRCSFLNQAAIECYEELETVHQVTLIAQPDGVGEIDFNMLDIESFPWVGEYFGGITNKIKANVFNEFEEEYEFSHWISTSGNLISPNTEERKAEYVMSEADTLIAVFRSVTVNTENLYNNFDVTVYPNPSSQDMPLLVEINDAQMHEGSIHLYNITGKLIKQTIANQGLNRVDLRGISSGLYFLEIRANGISKYKEKIVVR